MGKSFTANNEEDKCGWALTAVSSTGSCTTHNGAILSRLTVVWDAWKTEDKLRPEAIPAQDTKGEAMRTRSPSNSEATKMALRTCGRHRLLKAQEEAAAEEARSEVKWWCVSMATVSGTQSEGVSFDKSSRQTKYGLFGKAE
ncbi:hypothetical protein TNCV_2979021 [Trichonephila clavipes]|nr:hypothetical protein TNCV_2979021 [Trichonephila clavipes]